MPPRSKNLLGSVKPTGKAPAGQSTLHHLFGDKGEFERHLAETELQMGIIIGRHQIFKTQLDNLNAGGEKKLLEELQKSDKMVDDLLQGQANMIDDLAKELQARIDLNAPVVLQIRAANAISATNAKLKELFTGEGALDYKLVQDTLEEKIELLRMLEVLREENEELKAVNQAEDDEKTQLRHQLANARAHNKSLLETVEASASIKSEFKDANQDLQMHAELLETRRAEQNERANKAEANLKLCEDQLAEMKQRAETAEAARLQAREDLVAARIDNVTITMQKLEVDKQVMELNAEKIEAERQRDDGGVTELTQQLEVVSKEREDLAERVKRYEEEEVERKEQQQFVEGVSAFHNSMASGADASDAAAAFLATFE